MGVVVVAVVIAVMVVVAVVVPAVVARVVVALDLGVVGHRARSACRRWRARW